jgi:glycosyltransferase involved in cell wall biosynthesis
MESKKTLAPVILFAYNRPWHLAQTISSLKNNSLASETDLIIYSDSAKSSKDQAKVEQVRQFLSSISGFQSIKIIARDSNYGLAASIIEGVTETVNRCGKVIVMEDDMLTSPYFLQYMNDALDFYENEPEVMHVSAYMYPIDTQGLPESFFLKPATCWGWATWQRAWQHFEKNPKKLIKQFDKDMIKDFNLNNSFRYWPQVLANLKGRINTWAIFWYASIYLKGGYSLHPRSSYVQNIGLDGSGEHCSPTDIFSVKQLNQSPACQFSAEIKENSLASLHLEQFFRNNKRPLWSILLAKIARCKKRFL